MYEFAEQIIFLDYIINHIDVPSTNKIVAIKLKIELMDGKKNFIRMPKFKTFNDAHDPLVEDFERWKVETGKNL